MTAVNPEHVKAFVWLRWRLAVNQLKRGGLANRVVLGVVALLGVATAAGLFVGGFLAGVFGLPEASPAVRLYIWDGCVIALLFTRAIGLLADLQRSDGLALDRILHLPVSPAGGFLVNYAGSLVSVTLVLLVPGLAGLAVGGVVGDGPILLLGLPLLAAFVFALTAVVYQFQGFLASVLTNPRTRRTVVVLMTAGFILMAQAPNLLNLTGVWRNRDKFADLDPEFVARQAELTAAMAAGQITPDEHTARVDEARKEHAAEVATRHQAAMDGVERTVRLANVVLPPGWLALGMEALADGNPVPAMLGTAAFTLVGAFSLWRAYRTTVRLYTGEFTRGPGPAAVKPVAAGPARVRMVEWTVPFVSGHAAGVAAAALRGLIRAPEVKMALLAPVVMAVVVAALALTTDLSPPAEVRPFIAVGVAAVVLLAGMQLVGNQFGYDRDGFRVYVLGPAPRREILLGKNLAVVPLTLGPAVAGVALVGAIYPMRFDLLLAAGVAVGVLFLLACLVANSLSILAPVPLPAGAFKSSQVKLVPVLFHMAGMMVYPVLLGLVAAPLGVELLLDELGWAAGWPVALGLSVVHAAAAAGGYRRILTWQGRWLAGREQAILEVVTGKQN